jgi:Lon protease-like protein
VGTVARIVAAQSLPDGRAYLVTVGTRRIRVTEWLEDLPYPRAMVEDLEDDADAPPPSPDAYAALLATARRTMALAAELGVEAGDATREFGDDPVVGTFEVAAVAPLGALDRQRILSARSAAERCRLLEGQLAELTELLRFQLGAGDDVGQTAGDDDVGQTDVGQTDVGQTDVGQTDVGRTGGGEPSDPPAGEPPGATGGTPEEG